MNNKSVCDNQADFNVAFKKGLDYSLRDNRSMTITVIFYLISMVFALMLAARVQPGPNRTLHMTLAMLAPPLYIIAYYAGSVSSDE